MMVPGLLLFAYFIFIRLGPKGREKRGSCDAREDEERT